VASRAIPSRVTEYKVSFQHKYSYIRDERSGVESYPYPVKEGQRYVNLNTGHLFVQQPPKKGKGSRGSYKLFGHEPVWELDTVLYAMDYCTAHWSKLLCQFYSIYDEALTKPASNIT